MIKKFIVVLLIVFLFTSCANFMASLSKSGLENRIKTLRGADPKGYVESHPNLDSQIKKCILNNEVKLGMIREQVLASWGKPDDINRSVGSWGIHEQWIYQRGDYSAQYLYFENGILTSWQD